jgi:hypothetical protein
MNANDRKQLEAEIARELKALPELPAPASLVPRVIGALNRPHAIRWYQQPWPAWPAAWQASSLGIMLALFGGLCFAAWKASQAASLASALQEVGDSLAELRVIRDAAIALIGAAALVVKQLGTGFVVACLFVATCAYLSCVGLGTMVARYAFAKR